MAGGAAVALNNHVMFSFVRTVSGLGSGGNLASENGGGVAGAGSLVALVASAKISPRETNDNTVLAIRLLQLLEGALARS